MVVGCQQGLRVSLVRGGSGHYWARIPHLEAWSADHGSLNVSAVTKARVAGLDRDGLTRDDLDAGREQMIKVG